MSCEKLREVEERLQKACERAGRKREEVVLLGASKSVPAQRIREFYACGLSTFGENRVQEFLKKYQALEDIAIDWHFIGRLQSNKVKYILGKVSLIHSLDRDSLAQEINKRANVVQNVLIEVNVAGEKTKGGIVPENLLAFYQHLLSYKNLRVLGLMCIPPYTEDPEKARPYFAKLRELKEKLESEFLVKLPHLSMGMSTDFEVAIEEGATIVRIGTLLFGERR
ncbi:alanine racemase domain protein [Hydrogenobacter thermophilus TK-6]|uniref:Pyridoxal phosphate homeostasis protein n=1 Tax=Hydrogenobacter thermophilus (strain DSM 6534 / IAM 12695 / TK-6) TaxID=608538 RepID=D3DGV7_HYDTT|nr:YggS family pyridoxal phosphate-dependent enzyme [Hydrogenobacter thermophilus]ADO44994.1 alanine racemase domain protein [Hydrogenobacter thermophilus TK-6]BAI69059.1 alanine racemase domain protein [Hydrogenobacter thermophilus TK-6]